MGREPELGHLEETLDALESGSAACVAVEGEPGIGKTRLLHELRERAESRGHVVLSGAAAEFERDLPFSVVVDALDAYVVSQDLEERDGWSDELATELGRVLPSLGSAGGGEGAVADERFRAHRAVRRLLELIAAERPLVVVLDDLHWSDGASAELLAALVRRPPRARVLLALGFRPARVEGHLAAAVTGAGALRLELGQLSETQAAELLSGMDASAVADLYRRGGGNPFYLEQLGRSGDGTRSIAEAIAGELETLAPRSRAFLDGAAVAGEPFEPDLAAEIAELDQVEGLAALDDLIALDLVRSTDVPRRFAFRHPLVRSAVYEATGGGWRLAAHARAAEALARRGAAAPERAHHVEMSATQSDVDAIEVLLAAGEAAASRAPEAAARWYEGALRLLPAQDAERQVDVRVALANALRAAGDLERCRSALLEAIDLLPPDAVTRRVELTTLCAGVEHWRGLHDDAHRRLLRALEELPDAGTSAAAALQIELGTDGLFALDMEQALSMGSAALETARELDDRMLIAAAGAALGLITATAGRFDEAREHHAATLPMIDAATDEELAPRLEALFHLGWTETYLEHFDSAIEHAQRGMEIARSIGEGRLLGPLMLVQGYPFQMQGRLAEDLEMAETAVEAARLSANPHSLYWALYELAWAHYYAGAWTRPSPRWTRASRWTRGCSAGRCRPPAEGPAGSAPAASSSSGIPLCLETMRAFAAADFQVAVQRWFDYEIIALAEIALGNIEAAHEEADKAEEYAEQIGVRLAACIAGRTRAAVCLAEGDGAAAAAAAAAGAAAGRRSARSSRSRSRGCFRAAGWLPPARRRRRSRCCATPSTCSTSAARFVSATRPAASCASSARGPSRADRAPRTTPAWARSPSASARSPT